MKANDIKTMAVNDATKWIEALDFRDEIVEKMNRLTGYEEAYAKTFDKLAEETFHAHQKRMNDLVKYIDRIESKVQSHNWGKVTLVSCAIVGVYVFSQTEKGQALKNKLFRGIRSAKDNATEATIRYVNNVTDPEKKPTVEGETSS